MATIKHACIDCGEVRKVRQDKLANGLQSRCRQCHARFTAERRSKAMKDYVRKNKALCDARRAPRGKVFSICKHCKVEYEQSVIDGSGYCSLKCKSNALQAGYNFFDLSCLLLRSKVFSGHTEKLVVTARKQLLTHWRTQAQVASQQNA